ncbi:MAG TPA: hemerythrin domain-containing protein [Candidatus Elarobacter sp.]|nr:hemerythrin domain-containing protein [Candidatus Elarobacter sp.]
MAERNDVLRDAGLVAAGAAAGLMIGKFGLPLVAKTIGMTRAGAGAGDAFDELTADHKRVLAMLEKAQAEQTGPKKLALFAMIKRDLSKHSVAEEDIIYPLIGDKLLAPDAAHHLYKEHGDVKTLLAEIEEAIEQNDDMRYRARVRSLLENVRRHAEEEETQWFPRLKEILDEKKRALISGKVDREKAMLV